MSTTAVNLAMVLSKPVDLVRFCHMGLFGLGVIGLSLTTGWFSLVFRREQLGKVHRSGSSQGKPWFTTGLGRSVCTSQFLARRTSNLSKPKQPQTPPQDDHASATAAAAHAQLTSPASVTVAIANRAQLAFPAFVTAAVATRAQLAGPRIQEPEQLQYQGRDWSGGGSVKGVVSGEKGRRWRAR